MDTKDCVVTELAEWKDLEAHYEQMKDVHLRELFATDDARGERFTLEAAEVFLDYSKNRITDATLEKLLALAKVRGV